MKQEIEQMLKDGMIEPLTSEWASPIILVGKKDDTVRFCVDYRQLNAATQGDAYPLPRVDTLYTYHVCIQCSRITRLSLC